ncbi:MAG: DUF3368 domain-containing protein [Candidatus Freyarchaeota archaeon]|nr:DUF3368 domain-containing protein [Candidatus Jordarchaeia archaeon]MBS7280794.1 DUF3368 domain-containing protein [Candidatus Jordarchaeia archaeon]
MNVVLNASPLIYLGKKRRIDILRIIFEKSIIPPEVEEEIMKIADSPEAIQLQEAIKEGWITVEGASEDQSAQIVMLFPELDKGEAATIALAVEQRTEGVVIDDSEARVAAEYFKLKVYGTLFIILEAFKRRILKSKTEVRSMVDNMLKRGFYLSTEVYARFLNLLDKVR